MIKTNIYVAIPVGILLVLVTRPIARRVARQEHDPGLYRLLMIAVVTHLLFCSVQIWVVDHIYHGVTDYNRYINQGAILARRFDKFNFSLGGVQPPVQVLGQGSVSIAAGVVMAFVGVNKLALFYVFSWLAWLATLAFYRAFSVTFPEANRRRYALTLFFLPSLLFWTSGISKECMMFLSLGLSAYGAARVMAHERGGAPLLVAGTIIGVYVRPQELLLFMAAFVVAGVFRRKGTVQRSGRAVRRLAVMGLQAALLLAAISLSEKLAKHAPVFNLAQLAQNNRGQPSSINYKPGLQYYFRDVYFVLFDPTPLNAHGATQKLAAFENTVIIILFLTSIRRFIHLARTVIVKPYVLLCVMYAAAFPYAFAALNNLGLIDRERVLVLPFLLVPLCIPLTPRRLVPRYAWETSENNRERKTRQARWGAPVPARR